MKIAVVGGGSTYTPELIDGFARLRDALPLAELVLIDPAADRLELVGGLARRIFAKQGHPGRISWTSDVDAGVDGADAVLLQLRVGGQAARNQDETWPLECGCVGQETTGAGGLAKALRTVPVVLDIAERIRRRNPDAWIVDFTNPVGIVTRALLSHGHKAVGLCNVAIGFQRKFARLLGVAPERVELEHVGLNHLTWERAVRVDGEDVLPRLITEHGAAIAEDLHMPRSLVERLGVVPSYYLRYYYQHDEVVEELRSKPSRAAEVAAIEKQLLEMYGDPSLDEKPELLGKRGGAFYSEAAVALTSALLGDTGDVQIVNTVNNGTLPFLPDDAVIEVPATMGAGGAKPLPVRPLEPLYSGLIANVTAYEHLALEAALKGGRDRIFEALLAHPLIGQIAYADRLTDELIAHNREHLTWL
ncbi:MULTISPECIES: 6-phospho-beta-glucosidase [Streptomyces]|uniref:6-phospho-beta-glucosidase n=1 Tax=Streptomyces rimosus subsp. rimosus (strain ATCC 10970 / DSM 40260 / JCM 4667 / NRRL 2234) TaxID=1265868 RepID=A0A8A1V1I6_STRR1|nr:MULTISPECIES: 6-phospho-beta-glucosidase [Streptomyces]KOG71987.1 6-phospho-beta-glucosidase [Kitasatospora aureofaciens]MYT48620.1 6-phospho-beta-glucosidase [Streptomyces sp. SID5471]KEF06106.1 6-phospho-beta-glucosidase [Streptomyces rimosus]KEF19096.1 6-phospho-beta-glucosidase [Streptomyces rimosus]KOT26785.1 6-phospho-beta-glucosidase [Streptomyces sp. NRRL WC-3701]